MCTVDIIKSESLVVKGVVKNFSDNFDYVEVFEKLLFVRHSHTYLKVRKFGKLSTQLPSKVTGSSSRIFEVSL